MKSETLESIQRAIVLVGDGRGFVVETSASDRVVVTAAHCLPDLPQPHPAAYTEEVTFANLIGAVGRPADIWAECLFADPIADVAVLGGPDNQKLADEAEGYAIFCDAIAPLRIGDPRPLETVWLFTREGRWETCRAERVGFGLRLVGASSLAVEPGTSGSPIVSSRGEVVGLVSLGATWNPMLSRCLPSRLDLHVVPS